MYVDWALGRREVSESVAQVGPMPVPIAVLGILKEVVRGQTEPNPLVSNGITDGLDNLEQESTPVVD